MKSDKWDSKKPKKINRVVKADDKMNLSQLNKESK